MNRARSFHPSASQLPSPWFFALGTVLAPLLEKAGRRGPSLLLWLLSGSILGYTWESFWLAPGFALRNHSRRCLGVFREYRGSSQVPGEVGRLKGKASSFPVRLWCRGTGIPGLRCSPGQWQNLRVQSPGGLGLGLPFPAPAPALFLQEALLSRRWAPSPGSRWVGGRCCPPSAPASPRRPNRYCFRTLLGASSTLSCLSPPRQVPAPAWASSLLRVTSGRPTAEEEERGRGGLGGNALSIQPL